MTRGSVAENLNGVRLDFSVFLNRLYRAYHKNKGVRLSREEVDMLAEDDALYHRAVSEAEDESDRQERNRKA